MKKYNLSVVLEPMVQSDWLHNHNHNKKGVTDVTDRITITKGVTHTPEGKYTIWKKEKKTRDSPLRGDVGNSPRIVQVKEVEVYRIRIDYIKIGHKGVQLLIEYYNAIPTASTHKIYT